MPKGKFIRMLFVFIFLGGVYLLGPSPAAPEFDTAYPVMPVDPAALEKHIARSESAHAVKPDNEARVVWFDSTRRKTPCAIVYLHGFSASQKEGDPVHLKLARDFGCNLYLSRLADHGIDTTETLQFFTADRVWNSAKEALAIGNAIGDKVIVVGTSTGATLGLMLAAEYPDSVHALINLSPNIAINDPAAFLLNDPWGLQIARWVVGGKYMTRVKSDPQTSRYWNDTYRLEAVVELEELLESAMTADTFSKITQPSLTLYYYKNEAEQDPQVKVGDMLEMHEQLNTPGSLKIIRAMPEAGAHVLGSSLTSRDLDGVYSEMEMFMIQTLGMSKSGLALR